MASSSAEMIDEVLNSSISDHLEDLRYADDNCLLSSCHMDMQEMLDGLVSEARRNGLPVNSNKIKYIQLNTTNTGQFHIEGVPIQAKDSFPYLDSILATDGGGNRRL